MIYFFVSITDLLMFFITLMQVIERSTQKEQKNLTLENELRVELLVYKKQCFERSNKIITREWVFAEFDNEKQRMMDEFHQVGIVCVFHVFTV